MNGEKFMPEKSKDPKIYTPETDPIELARKKKEIEARFAEKALSGKAQIVGFLQETLGKSQIEDMTNDDIEAAVGGLQEMGTQAQEIEREMTPRQQVSMRHGEIKKLLQGQYNITDVKNAYAAAALGLLSVDEAINEPNADTETLEDERKFFADTMMWLSGLYNKDLGI
ncbi:hypothetical protein ACFL2U_03260 [Patescibacteria group bacterium]